MYEGRSGRHHTQKHYGFAQPPGSINAKQGNRKRRGSENVKEFRTNRKRYRSSEAEEAENQKKANEEMVVGPQRVASARP